jgi:hypothetical protein
MKQYVKGDKNRVSLPNAQDKRRLPDYVIDTSRALTYL